MKSRNYITVALNSDLYTRMSTLIDELNALPAGNAYRQRCAGRSNVVTSNSFTAAAIEWMLETLDNQKEAV